MKTLTVAQRQWIGLGIVIMLLMAVAALGISRMAQLNKEVDLLVNDRWIKVAVLRDLARQSNQIATALRDMLLTEDDRDIARLKAEILASRQHAATGIEALQRIVTLPRGKALLEDVILQRQDYLAAQDGLIALVERGAAVEARLHLNGEMRTSLRAYEQKLHAFNDFQTTLVAEAGKLADESYRQGRKLMIGMVVLSLVLAAVVSIWVVRSVTRPLGGEPDEVKAIMQRIGAGDLTTDIRPKVDDTDSLMVAASQMQAALRTMIQDMRIHAESMASDAQQLTAISAGVAAATEQQSSSASAMAAAVEEMTVSVNHVADSAREAHAVTTDTGVLSHQGKGVIGEMADGMRHIASTVGEAARTIESMGKSSQRISGIVQVIREVAEQTNLLALNAEG